MRDRVQLELTVPEYHQAKRAERQRNAAQLHAMLKEAERTRPDWYQWILDRRDGVHNHGLKRANGKRAACPVRGCDIVRPVG